MRSMIVRPMPKSKIAVSPSGAARLWNGRKAAILMTVIGSCLWLFNASFAQVTVGSPNRPMALTPEGYRLDGPASRRGILSKKLPEWTVYGNGQRHWKWLRVHMEITSQGIPGRVRVVKSCGDNRLDALYMDVAKSWRFAPVSAQEQQQDWLMIAFPVDLQKWQESDKQKNAGRDVNGKDGSILNTPE